MFELLITMLERLGIIVAIAFILTRLKFFRGMIYQDELNRRQKLVAIVFFGFFGIIGTYTGLSLNTESLQFNRWASDLTSDEALANSRVIGVVLAGLLGGYKVGLGAGLIAGIHRFTLGGFTAFSCGFASIIAGYISGYFYKKNKHIKLSTAFIIAATAEALQMLVILLFSQPFEKAWALVEIIGIPMIVANGLGCTLFLMIIKSVINEGERVGAVQAQKTLRIADKTLAYLRHGLNQETAHEVCHIIQDEIKATAVAMTNTTKILAHVGQGHDHHQTQMPIQTQITLNVINKGEIVIANKKMIQCRSEDCPLGAAVIAPLKRRDETIGTLKFYFRYEKEITPVVTELISGLSALLSNQLEIAEADKAFQLAKEAEIKVLQAQINPHFLFNTLNTILSLVRSDPTKARKLLVSLSHFLRQNMSVTTQNIITLEHELRHVKAYLEIEETRFVDKLKVFYQIDEGTLHQRIPPLTLQPIVENAIKHGIKERDGNSQVIISIQKGNNHVHVSIEDNGIGMSEERAKEICVTPIKSSNGNGVALYNVNRRLMMLFGEKSGLNIKSEINKGTEIAFTIPLSEVV
ncbi:sensor histidine kinase [Schinkia azotoformans]|uniref:sensor histidine kinase n=1 Tax=Schinkia azotoformans TaxID=1454 RepID=UPI002DBB63A6|nr:sensor histidine kinase [Schinkia azotoformans]MEC1694398.1 sensor histidine kinase [Schinkia azotoformans]MEC1714437.1 sensor histidine kinase [Schinkia azotoformans]MEC1723209.1 sensor histidine kinase [Schinkia azotoformans]MEC1740468.1 sensor histidine kinase [Schinkia azotoformans]MEC1744975.1 sensor histidine kinase [Schinkia azotoformans]